MNQTQNQNQAEAAVAYYPPPPPPSTVAPPPAGYPTKDAQAVNPVPVTTKSRGDGFWKGCCAGLCCCCALDVCF